MPSLRNMSAVVPIRQCLVTGAQVEKVKLMRFVVDPEKNLIADIDQTLPGRGYWVMAEHRVITKAIEKNIFLKSIKENIKIKENLLLVIETQIKVKIVQQLSLARKAGLTIFGFDKIKSCLSKQSINLLIQAIDGSDKEKKRLLTKSIPKIINNCLSSSELGKAFGREQVIHCAVLGNSFAEKIIFNANRLNNLKNPLPHYNNVETSKKN